MRLFGWLLALLWTLFACHDDDTSLDWNDAFKGWHW